MTDQGASMTPEEQDEMQARWGQLFQREFDTKKALVELILAQPKCTDMDIERLIDDGAAALGQARQDVLDAEAAVAAFQTEMLARAGGTGAPQEGT